MGKLEEEQFPELVGSQTGEGPALDKGSLEKCLFIDPLPEARLANAVSSRIDCRGSQPASWLI